MNRKGFALLSMLWVLALLSTVVAGLLVTVKESQAVAGNRITLLRGKWAREACVEILSSLHSLNTNGTEPQVLDTVELGRGAWCRAVLEDPQARLNINSAPVDLLRRVLASDSLADALADWRDPDLDPRQLGAEASWYLAHRRTPPRNGPLADVRELQLVRGFEAASLESLKARFTTSGTGRINLNSADRNLVRGLSLGSEVPAALSVRRTGRGRFDGFDDLSQALSADGKAQLAGRYPELSQLVVFQSDRMTATVEGGVRGERPVSRAVMELGLAGNRLAVLKKSVE